ncbi:MAG: hypothetical protein IH608_04300 [Proteobacteria bacterium]|nr:hypothetical protein [Pseudomonadota bacterium]
MARMLGALPRWGTALAVVLLLQAGARAAEQTAQTASGQPPTLVFVTKSDACECERNLCIAGEQEVRNFLSANPWGFRLEKVDLKATPEAAKELGILAVPVVFLLDGPGRRVARFDGFFAERDFYQAWENHLDGEKR